MATGRLGCRRVVNFPHLSCRADRFSLPQSNRCLTTSNDYLTEFNSFLTSSKRLVSQVNTSVFEMLIRHSEHTTNNVCKCKQAHTHTSRGTCATGILSRARCGRQFIKTLLNNVAPAAAHQAIKDIQSKFKVLLLRFQHMLTT